MSKFGKKNKKGMPAISTASLPDIVFMLLIFFMVTTVPKENNPKVRVSKPEATEVVRIDDLSRVYSIYVGPAIETGQFGESDRIQVGGEIVPDAIYVQNGVNTWRGKFAENEHSGLTMSIKADQEARMFVVNQVKENLREINALKIIYSTKKRKDD
jgi:biopolymer transport protein ExbD